MCPIVPFFRSCFISRAHLPLCASFVRTFCFFPTVLPRMALLVQHLASLAAAVAPDEDPVLNMDTPIHGHSDGAVVDSISNALARFFPALPDSKLALVVWSDWIAFAHDLAIVREADVWNDIHAVDGACSDTAILAAVEVPLFEETVAALNGRDDDNVDVSWSLSFSLLDGCYNIRITNADALQTLQMVVLNVLSHAVVVRKTRWLQDNNNEYYPSPTTTTLPIVLDAVEVLEDRDETYYTASSTMDLYYAGVPFRSVQILMIVLRQALLGKEVTSLMSQSPMTKASDPIVVQQRLQLTATDILVQLQADWHRTAAPNMGILLEVSLLVVRYCVMFVKHRSALVTSCSSLASDIAANLSILVSTLVLVPPLVGGSATRSSIVSVVHGATMEDLCESLLFLSQWSDSTNDLPVSGRTNNISQSQTQLPVVLLRTINTMLHTAKLKDAFSADSDLSFALPLVLTREGVSVLFQLLHDRTLSDNAMFILSHLLCRAFQFGDCDHFDIDGVTEKFIDEALHHTKDGSLRVEHCEVEASATSGAKRMTSPFVTSGEERATVLIKRQRLCGDWARNTTISFFTDELLCYFGHALHSASSLQASAQSPRLSDGKSWIDSQLSDALLTEFLNVSGALRLVLTAARLVNTRRSFSPALLRMVEIFLNSMSTVNEAVLKTILPEGEEKSLLLRTIAESSVVCGLCIELSAGSAFSDLSSAISCSQNAAILAKKWIMIPCWLTSTKTHSRAFDETIYGFSLLKDADERLAQRNELSKLLRVFEGHVASASIDVIKSGLLCVRFSSMFESLGGDTILHRQRLRTIASYLGKQWNETSSSTELEIFTLEVCMLADKGRADTIVRFLLWQSVAWMFFSVDPKRLREQIASVFTSCSESDRWTSTFLVHTLVDTACSDPDPMVRDYCSRHLGKVLSANNWNSFIASYSTHEEWDQVRSTEIVDDAEIRLEESFKSVAGRFFRYIDCFLNKSSSATQPLSSSTNADHSVESDEGFSRSALRSLSSFFFAKDATIYENCGDVIINLALVRIVRLWSAALAIQAIDMSCVYFFEMTSLSYRHPFRNTHSSGGAHFVFREMLGSSLEIDGESGDIESRNCGQIERKFDFLSTLVRFVCLDGMPLNDVSDLSSHSDLVEMCLPRAITQLVIDKQYDALQLIAGYDHYFRSVILSEQKHLRKSIKISIGTRFSPGLISTNARTLTTLPLSKQWSRDLQKTTSNLCIGTRMSEQILPPILIHGSQDVTVFFFEKVLKGKLTMKQMLDNKGMIILKNFITELGQSPENLVSIVVAMKKAASVRKNVGNEEDNSALVAWTTEYFMYLLVNIVQQKWSTKSIKQRVNSLRSLLYSFDYLSPSEASQYFPQILAIVNTSSSEDGHSRYMAARILVKFVTLVARSQWEVVGQHLTSIVVSLIPIFEDDGAIKESKKFDPICRQCAIDFLEWLTQGDLGVKLTPYFSNIPFLPQSNALSTFHATLVSLGVKFDDLDVSCVSATPDCDHLCRISDTVSSGGDSRGASTNSGRQLALRRRLETVCPLLRSERVGIRRVVLIHITSVLRANRDVFQTLLENDSATSVKRFVTLSYPGQTGKDSIFMFARAINRGVSLNSLCRVPQDFLVGR